MEKEPITINGLNNLKSELQKFDPNMTFQSDTKDNSLSQNNNNSDLDFASTSNAFTNENMSLASTLGDYDAFNEKFNIVPFDISQDDTNVDSDITSTSFFAETDLPAFSIFDNDNFYRDLAQTNYGVYD